MKAQTFGIAGLRNDLTLKMLEQTRSPPDMQVRYKEALIRAHYNKECNWTVPYLKDAYNDYRINRENGEAQDNPTGELSYDGKAEWEQQPNGYYRVKYTEGPSDKLWMEAKDRNYVFRLEREGHLDKLEPNLRTEVPRLYEEVMVYRGKRTVEEKAHGEGESLERESVKREIEEMKKEKRCNMKTQTFGLGFMCITEYDVNCKTMLLQAGPSIGRSILPREALYRVINYKEQNWTEPYLKSACDDYKINRENGEVRDNPASELKHDGNAKWEIQHDGYYHVKYTEGPSDKAWMEAKDRKYVFRLEREGLLDELEPNLRTEVPKLYEEVMAKRAAEAKVRTGEEAKKRKAEEERKAIELRENQERERKAKEQRERQEKTRAEAEAKKRKAEKPIEQKIEAKSFDRSYLIAYTKLTFGRELGKGGFGTVYQGKWQCVDVAIKQLYLNSLSTESLEEFQSEAAMMTKLHHPNVVILYGVSIDQPGKYSLVMEYIPKGSLYATLHNKQPLDWNLRYRISMDIGAGLLHLHEQNILHRDLKSMNVLLDDRMRAKLSDFGLSKLRTETTTTATQVGAFTGAGTLPWMAPELFKRKGKDTKAGDMYSLGMVFWEIASRLVPFADAKDPQQIIAWKKDGETEDIPKDCPPKYAKLITWCWQEQTTRPTINQAVEILEQMMAQNNQSSPSNNIYQNIPAYQQDSLNLAEENKSMPDYQFNTLNIKP